MNKSLEDLKVALSYAMQKVEETTGEEQIKWVNKVDEFQKMIDESIMLLEG